MSTFRILKGKDIKLKGAARKEIVAMPLPRQVAIQPSDFLGLKLRLAVKADDAVKAGSVLLTDKAIPEIRICSPVSGKIAAINRGDKRLLLEIVVETDGHQQAERLAVFPEHQIPNLSKQDIIKHLLEGGLWPTIRQRPFSKIANPHDAPKSVFIHAMNTEPLALDIDFILNNRQQEFQTGLNILKKLTGGEVHLCAAQGSKSKALTESKNVQIHQFAGPHPAGNVSTHIHYVDPLNKDEVVWYIEAQDVLRIAALFTQGIHSAERVVAVTGEMAKNRVYARTVIGAPLSSLLQGSDLNNARCISGSILAGKDVGKNGFLRFYDSQISVIPEGGERKLLDWMSPGFNKYTFSKTFVSSFLPEKEVSLDTDKHGSDRAIVFNHIYDQYVPLDIMTFFLLKAVLSGDIEEAEKLGILECDEEDFALCSFACPSKTDVGGIIRQGLDLIEREG